MNTMMMMEGVPKAAENFWIRYIPPTNSTTPRWIGRAHSWVHTTPQPWMLSGPVKRRGSEPWDDGSHVRLSTHTLL